MKVLLQCTVTLILILVLSNLKAQDIGTGKDLKKNSKYVGLLLAYSDSYKENTKTSFENIVSGNDKQSSIKFGGGYFFKDKLAVGLGFNLSSDKINKEVKNSFGPNTFTDSKTNGFGFSPFIKNFIGLDKNHHFYLYAQTGLQLGFEKGSETSTTGSTITETTIKSNSYGISFAPGLLAFIEKGFAFEVNVGVGGINHSTETRITAGQPDAIIKETNVDLSINILKMNLGISYNF